jgi:hypothetical protein
VADCDWCGDQDIYRALGRDHYVKSKLFWICRTCQDNKAVVRVVNERRSLVHLIPLCSQVCLLAFVIFMVVRCG